ncbi:MAG: ABC-type transporter [Microgenomates group bacterium GW2011_GWC1_41_20]|nr:MAG: ABC-type transporter [Candidatus Woesebacteria bacterium GW2011_GWD1_41_12]KKS00416.1 MAG: ABC-type transporter [Microgenomates group bacterium GW2011_GWC1_41_20]KKS16160.1 MAG: ABC-type transporter [Candidatus Woesebacteria bacterium GW2011_GWA1_41_7]
MIATTFAYVFELITPYFFKLFVNTLQTGDFDQLYKLILIYIATQFAGLVFGNLKYLLGDIVAVDTSIDIRRSIFKYVQELDISFHSGKSTGALISAFKRGDNAFWGLYERLNQRMWEIVIGFAVMGYFFIQIDYRFVLIFLVSFLLTLVATKYLAGYNIKTRNEFNEWEDQISGIITDNLINYETVKLFAKEGWEQNRLKNTFKTWKKFLWRHFWTYRMIDMSIGSLVNISVFLVLAFSLNLIKEGGIGIGDFVLIISYVSMFFPKLFDLIYGLREISTNLADIKKYFELLDHQVDVKDPENPVKVDHVYGEIIFKNVKFAYQNRFKSAINGINLTIEQGQSVALVGRSGSGKTSLVKLLMRFFDLSSGRITIDGININDFTKDTLRGFIGTVPQEPILFNNTIAYNIGYAANNPTLAKIREAAKLANIDNFIQSLPKKYETEVGERGVKLSGGQKQRLAIARMILSNPDIVVFDEATSQLDSESEKLIQDAFWKARAGKTTIIIAHRLSTIMRADKIVVMERGKIKEMGTHESLIAKKDSLYSHFWNLQIKLD